jgi:hypothetical protein
MNAKDRVEIAEEMQKLFELKGLYFGKTTDEQIKALVRDICDYYKNRVTIEKKHIIKGIKRLAEPDWQLSKIDNSIIIKVINTMYSMTYREPDPPPEEEREKCARKIDELKEKYGRDYYKHLAAEW